ncbi:MAG: aminopeptidase P family protein [Stomatobaculum sp.]|nr:aminopeptidase P family protein [Stomatobaculum sp.]
MRKELEALRGVMKEEGITAWISPCCDAHGSEYIGEHDQCVRFLSGFTGDSCTLLVLEEEAYLWTDGRYFEQAEKELAGSGITLMKMGEKNVPAFLAFLRGHLGKEDVPAFYAPLFGAKQGRELTELFKKNCKSFRTDTDLVDRVWKDRPPRSASGIWVHPREYAGEDAWWKILRLREALQKEGCTCFFTGALDETAWILNLRGGDIACNPVFLSYLLLKEDSCVLFVQPEALTEGAVKKLQGVEIRDYDEVLPALQALEGEVMLMDLTSVPFSCWNAVREKNHVKDVLSPAARMKCVKNETEIRCMKRSHLRDGVYLTKYLFRVKKVLAAGRNITETEAAEALDRMRAEDPLYISLSFPTISAYGANAAMAHYMPRPETAAVLRRKGLYLVDSGAQYLDGTTDVTRTIALGPVTRREKRDYTLTVIGMLRLMHAVFPAGTRGMNLDTIARQAMWETGVDFNHGTGHGVGFLNNVHEMPVSVRMRPSADPKRDIPFEPGMVTSDEPGVYVPGKYGIRTENLLLCTAHPKYEGFCTFAPLTLAPLDPEPLDRTIMSEQDVRWYNEYQALVRKKIGPKLTEEERDWLNYVTREI